MKFSKKNFAQYAKNAIVKNIITIDKYNVGMKSLAIEQLLLVTLPRQKRLQFLFLRFRFRFRFRIPDSRFSIRPEEEANQGNNRQQRQFYKQAENQLSALKSYFISCSFRIKSSASAFP